MRCEKHGPGNIGSGVRSPHPGVISAFAPPSEAAMACGEPAGIRAVAVADSPLRAKQLPFPVSPINLQDKLARFDEHWAPRIVAELNDQHVKIAKMKGGFDWDHHPAADEFFLVLSGTLTIQRHDADDVRRGGRVLRRAERRRAPPRGGRRGGARPPLRTGCHAQHRLPRNRPDGGGSGADLMPGAQAHPCILLRRIRNDPAGRGRRDRYASCQPASLRSMPRAAAAVRKDFGSGFTCRGREP